VAPPFKVAEFDIMYNEGISKEGSVLDIGSKEDIVQKSGSWFSYKDVRLGQGRENAKQYLKENPELMKEIEVLIREKFNLPLSKVDAEKAKSVNKESKTVDSNKDDESKNVKQKK